MEQLFKGFGFRGFWQDSDFARAQYVDDPLTEEKVAVVESTLGLKLPAAYIYLAKRQNGGMPKRTCYPTRVATSWAADHIAVAGIFSIGSAKPCSLLGRFGTGFWCEEWGYPELGIYFADCPSAGHDMICLDYRDCGRHGEPSVVHVDHELDNKITCIANSFEAFVRGLEPERVS